jgi:uncharacterized membrane protein YeaQ/YmgE (transglycosylase-associated protein family)
MWLGALGSVSFRLFQPVDIEDFSMFFILALILVGLIAGGLAERIVYPHWKIDWTEAFIVGLSGSLLGGLIVNLTAGNGFTLAMSGLIGSILGAIVLLAILKFIRGRIMAAGK